MKIFLSKLLHKLGYLLASAIILVALLVSMMRLLTPVLNQHRADFEALASKLLETPVLIQQVQVSWHGYSPEFSLNNVTVLDKDTLKPKVVMKRFDIAFSLWRSLTAREVVVENITVSGLQLTVNQKATGQVQVGQLGAFNMEDTMTGASVETDKAFAWIFSQPRLALENIDLFYILPNQPKLSIKITNLSLRNDEAEHVVDGEALLNQEMPTKVELHFVWNGDVRKLEEARGHFYVYLEGFSLPQWLSKYTVQGLQIKSGLASVKIWASWQNKQWDKIQSSFEAFGVELNSAQRKQSQMIDRISANIGWKREGNSQIFGGDQIYIDLPHHLWPVTDFHLQTSTDAQGNLLLQGVSSSYLDITDISHFLLMTDSLLSDSQRQTWITLDPKGEIKNLQANLSLPLSDMQSMLVSGEFDGLTVNAWQNIPAVMNLAGQGHWDGKQGELKLDSSHATITDQQLFAKPISLNHLLTTVAFQKAATGDWSIQAKNMTVENDDAKIQASLALTLPVGNSPVVDFNADFQVSNAGHISHYLPTQTFDPDLAHWLQSAFLSGSGQAGKIILQGKLADFPFDHNDGKFLISSQVDNLDFLFAPGWPQINQVHGVLTFAGRVMTADVDSGKMLNVPIGKVHAEIPYIGDAAPQILGVNGNIQADLADALRFIRQSPLQKGIGRKMSALQLQGPMQLALTLSIPIKHPDLTKVNGDVTTQGATLTLPEWNLVYSKVSGGFDFTDDGIEAKNLQGQLLGNPAVLNMTTLRQNGKAQQIRADLSSVTSIATLQNWLSVPLSKVVTGATPYQAQLFLSSPDQSQPDHVVIQSDLKGISVNLPAPYNKLADASVPFQLDLILNEGQFLKAKLDYAKLISAAMQIEKTKQGLQFVGGELRFGGQSANWQNGAGVLIAGRMNELDVAVWQQYFTSLQNSSNAKTNSDMKLLRRVDLNVNGFNLLGQQLHHAHIQASCNADVWSLQLASDEIAGQIQMPEGRTGQPIEAHLQHLNLTLPTIKQAEQAIDPRALPALNIDAIDVRFANKNIGHVFLRTVPTRSGLSIQQLQIDENNLKLNARGDWTGSSSRSATNLQGDASSAHVSDVLQQWGVSSTNFVAGKGDVSFNLNWQDAPYRLSLAGLTGTFSIKLGEGRIIEISESSNAEMGFGRMLNIFSLSSIPRRLSLDFSDIVQKGYSFDYMKGDFTLKEGSAFTEGMRFDGPIARVDIKGRVGLKAQDVDLMLGVTPYVTSSLPVVAAIAGGPVAGVATWFVSKVISSGVSRVTTYQYQVTGSWSNPVWNKISATSQKVSSLIMPSGLQSNNGVRQYPLSQQKTNSR